MIRVTDNAVKQLHHLLSQEELSQDKRGLRILVAKGGCAGMEYQMKIDQPSEGDTIIAHEGAEFYIDTEIEEYKLDVLLDLYNIISTTQAIIFCNTIRSKAIIPEITKTDKDKSMFNMKPIVTPNKPE